MAADDFALLQMDLLEFIHLIDGGREQGLLHQEQVIIRFDPHNGIDDIFETRGLGPAAVAEG